jgi:hypothetical protein
MPQKQTQTNPNKANPTPVFRSPEPPKAKTNPNEPKANPISQKTQNQPTNPIYRGEAGCEAGTNPISKARKC